MTACSCATPTASRWPGTAPRRPAIDAATPGMQPQIAGDVTLPDGRRALPGVPSARRTLPGRPLRAGGGGGHAAASRPRRSAASPANWPTSRSTRRSSSTSPGPTRPGRRHEKMLGRPVAMHAMRGISAHSNGFHTCRAIHLLQMLLGAVDTPGSWRYKSPYPRPIPPGPQPGRQGHRSRTPCCPAWRWAIRAAPRTCCWKTTARPVRIDKAFTWDAPIVRARADAHA